MKALRLLDKTLIGAALLSLSFPLLAGCGARPAAPGSVAPSGPAPAGSAAASGPAWVSDPGLSGQLGPEEQVGGYGIRPPAGYTEQQIILTAKDGSGMRYIWTGPADSGGVSPYLQMDVGIDNSPLGKRITPDEDVQLGYLVAARDHGGMTDSTIGQGTINGLAFSRGY